MKVDTRSTQTRLIIAVSAAWAVVAALMADSASRYSDFELREWLPPFLAFSAPAWLFWSCGWIFNWSLPFRRRPEKRWITVSPEEATRHPLYGVRGWAAFLAAGMWAAFIVLLVSAGVMAVAVGGLPTTKPQAYDFLSTSLVFLGATASGLVVLSIHKRFPKFQLIIIAAYVYFSAFPFIDTALFVAILEPNSFIKSRIWDGALRDTAKHLPTTLLWAAYVIRSRRINVTFRHRIRQVDLPLVRAPEQTKASSYFEAGEAPPPGRVLEERAS